MFRWITRAASKEQAVLRVMRVNPISAHVIAVDLGIKVGAIFQTLSKPKCSLCIARERLRFGSHEVRIAHLSDVEEHCKSQAERRYRALYSQRR